MEQISLHIKIPVEMKKYLKIQATLKGITLTDYVMELLEKDKARKECK